MPITDQSFNDNREKFSGQTQPTVKQNKKHPHRSNPSSVFYMCKNKKKNLSPPRLELITLLSKNRKAVTKISTPVGCLLRQLKQ